jgi:metallophosphoesterase superfamily enzyme
MIGAQPAVESYGIAPGILALPKGLLALERTRTLVAADVHFAYEEVIGGALPLWSTATTVAALGLAVRMTRARELVLLGDIIHGSTMSAGAGRVVAEALASLRTMCDLVLIAGNHEGRTRGAHVLGETRESIERDGWLLLHGDVAPSAPTRCIVGHIHPSLHLGGDASTPAFLGGERLIVVPALTPYSPGLDVLSHACSRAVRAFGVRADELNVVACGPDRVYPFGRVGPLRSALRPDAPQPSRFRRKYLSADR